MSAIALWSVHVQPGKKITLVAQSDIHVTNAALDATLIDEKARSSVKFTYEPPQKQASESDDDEDKPAPVTTSTILCSLTPGKIEQASLNIILSEDETFTFEVVGKNAIHLSGNYITQGNEFPDDDSEIGSDEDGYDLRDVSSDVEANLAELDDLSSSEEDDSHRFQEINDEPTSSKKRPHDANAMEVEVEPEVQLSKQQKKKLNKKQKADDGTAVPTGEPKTAEPKGEKEKKEKKDQKEKKEKKEGEKEVSKKLGEMKEIAGGLKIKDMKDGAGKEAKKGNIVSMRYVGKFTDGKIFDSNTKGKPFTFKLGAGEVIKGWDEGIAGMKSGGERLLIVPPNMGYGSRKNDSIPANSTLRFECKLLEIKG